MRRTLLTAVLCGLAMFVAYRWGSGLLLGGKLTVVVKPDDAMPVTSVLVVATGLAWIAFTTCTAVRDVADMVAEARGRRAEKRRRAREEEMLAPYFQVGRPPVRPDAVANQAA